MTRTFQRNISQTTEELTEQILKDITKNPVNNGLIDSYRDFKRRMAEAEARQVLDEFVKAVTESDDYKEWLKPELQKEMRRKKKVPETDFERVKLYIGQKKSSLPAVIPTVTHFAESTDRWGRTGLWRVQK